MIKQGNIEMKKALFVFYLLFFTFNIYSISYYISNSIGQKISPTTASGVYRNNYVLRVDDNYEQLYNKGELVKSYTYETIEPTNQNNVTENFADKIHRLAEYVRSNPDKMTLNKMQDVVLEILPLNIKFVEIFKYKYPKIFESVIKK